MYELPSTAQWCFDVQWCPRNPDMISVASFDGRICVYSLLGGGTEQSTQSVQVCRVIRIAITSRIVSLYLIRHLQKLIPVIHSLGSVHSPH